MRIEKDIYHRTKRFFKNEIQQGKSYEQETKKLCDFLGRHEVTKMSKVTPEVIEKYYQSGITESDRKYVEKIFSQDKLNRIEKARQNGKYETKVPLSKQLHNRMQELNKIGQEKFQVKMILKNYAKENNVYINPLKSDGIYSHGTYNAYKQTSIEFEKYLSSKHPEIKSIDQITKEHAKEYLLYRQSAGYSKFTVDKDMAALNKVLRFDMTKKEVGLARKHYYESTRSRKESLMDKKYNPENYKNQIFIAQATGIRRESMLKITGNSFVRDETGKITGITVKEKGGKIRTAQVLRAKQDEITKIVNELITEKGRDHPLFDKYTSKIDNHAFRAEYARFLYQEFVEQQGRENKDYQKKYDKEILKQVSQNLGHERITIVVHYYLR